MLRLRACRAELHLLAEYRHSSAPEVFLVACGQVTDNLRLGNGIVQLPGRLQQLEMLAKRSHA